jgi:hypothetical protein
MVESGYVYYRERYERVFVEAQAALSDCRIKIVGASSAAGTISGATGITPLSWGESIRILVGTSPCGTYVSASSSAKVNDSGKGGENLRRFFEALDRRLSGARIWATAPGQGQQSYGTTQYGATAQNYTPIGQPTPPGMMGAMAAATANGGLALFVGLAYTGVPGIGFQLGACLTTAAMMLIIGAALIGAKSYKAGAVLCAIGGLITVPLGFMGIWTAGMAVKMFNWRKDNPWATG